MTTLSTLVVGYGLAGRVFHAPLISAEPGLSLDGIVTSNAERTIQARERYPHVEVFPSLDAALERGFDLVTVGTPNVTHVPFTEQALRAGCNVVLDKPVSANAQEAMALAALADEQGRLLIPFQNRRWDSDYLTAAKAAASGALGMIHRFESHIDRMRVVPKIGWRESADPADLGGMLYDLGAHAIDQTLTLMGPVTHVSASVRSVRPQDPTDDDVVMLLTHDSGAVSIVTVSQVAAFSDPRITLLGTHGGFRVHATDTQEAVLNSGVLPEVGWGVEPAGSDATLRTFDDDSVMTETRVPMEAGSWPEFYRAVAACIRGEEPPPVLIGDVIESMRVMDAAREAGATGSTVTLDPPAGHA